MSDYIHLTIVLTARVPKSKLSTEYPLGQLQADIVEPRNWAYLLEDYGVDSSSIVVKSIEVKE